MNNNPIQYVNDSAKFVSTLRDKSLTYVLWFENCYTLKYFHGQVLNSLHSLTVLTFCGLLLLDFFMNSSKEVTSSVVRALLKVITFLSWLAIQSNFLQNPTIIPLHSLTVLKVYSLLLLAFFHEFFIRGDFSDVGLA